MATQFKKDQMVSVKAVIPKGPVQKVRMDEDGAVHYLIGWVDANGATQQRWFLESDLIEA
jgi:hypothetical protein